MNILLITFLVHKSFCTKRKNSQHDIIAHNAEESVNIPVIDRLIDINDLTNNEPHSKLGKQDDFANICKEIFTFLDTCEFTDLRNETGEDLDKLQNTNDNNQILTSEQLDAFVNGIFENIKDHYEENCNNIALDTEEPIIEVSCHLNEEQPNELLYLAGDIVFVEPEGNTFKSFLHKYILDYIPSSFNDNFFRRIEIINDACLNFDKFKVTSDTKYPIFNQSHDESLLNRLLKIISTFEKGSIFNNEVCDKFMAQFDPKILQVFYYIDLRLNSVLLSDEQKSAIFYFELVKLYKHVKVIPEILTIGGLFSVRSFRALIIIIHSINLFIEKLKDIKENRVFILCMISKAFECSYGKQFDIFRITAYTLQCMKRIHELNFFSWEYNCIKRRDLKKRKSLTISCKMRDRKYFKTVLLIFLYQHTLFIKYHSADKKYLKKFQIFVNKVIKSKDCDGCLFEEYLRDLVF